MKNKKSIEKICKKGHTFFKTSDCPSCPICEQERKPSDGFLSLLGAPARRALQGQGIITLQKLSTYNEKELLQLHGIGKSSIPILKEALNEVGLSFKK